MKILMLHGSIQSGELFRAKTEALEKQIKKFINGADLVYPTAPFEIKIPGSTSAISERHGTWRWFESQAIDGVFPGLEVGLNSIASVIKESGPFDGVIGFSQGAAMAALVASLLEEDRANAFMYHQNLGGMSFPTSFAALNHPPFKFIISIAGYKASDPAYEAFYGPLIQTPSLHILGSMDTVVDDEASTKLVECFQKGISEPQGSVIRHPGGHTIPVGKNVILGMVNFIQDRGH